MSTLTFHPSSGVSLEKRKKSVRKYGEWWKQPPTMRFKRAGVIPITWINGQLYFFLGLYKFTEHGKDSVELSDFGGGVKIGETFILAAEREFEQESGKVFPINLKDAYCHDYCDAAGNIVSKTYFPVVSAEYISVRIQKTEEMAGSQWVSATEFMVLTQSSGHWKKPPQNVQLFIKVANILKTFDISKIPTPR